MAGLLGDGWDDPRSSAMMALAGGLLKGDVGAGLLGANSAYADAKQNAFKSQYMQAQMQNMQLEAQQKRAAMERQARIQAGIPGLFRAPGMTGGQAVPQMEGDTPMYSRPMGVTPMQATPGGFDVQGALRLGLDPDAITKYAGLNDLGRAEVARTVEVDDGKGGKATMQIDKFGRPVGENLPAYLAPVQVNQGDRVTFQRPTAGATLPINMSPSERASNSVAWANHGLSSQRLAFDKNQATKPQFNDGTWYYPPTQQNPQGAAVRPQMPAGMEPKLTEVQGSATQFATRMLDASRTLDALEGNVWPSTVSRAGYRPEFPAWLPGGQMVSAGLEGINRATVPAQAEQYHQARENWVTANLRKESGAVIGKDEMERELRKWFPQPGEGADSIKQKAAARKVAEQGMLVQAGPGKAAAERLAREAAARAAQGKNPTARAGMGSGTALDETDPLGLRR